MKYKNKKILLVSIVFLTLIMLTPFQINNSNQGVNTDEISDLNYSSGLEGAENIIITTILRNVEVSGSGIINIEDDLTVKNTYNNPIPSILVGIPLNLIDNLIYFKSVSSNEHSLLSERSNLIMNDNEMIMIHFDTPLFPKQNITITFSHSYANIPIYYIGPTEQNIDYSINPFPILPYKTEKEVRTLFRMPETSEVIDFEQVEDIGNMITDNIYEYDLANSLELDYLEPFLENLKEEEREITISFRDMDVTKMQIESVTREIYISAWGLIRIREEILIQNIGFIQISLLSINIPILSKNLRVFDDIGDLEISTFTENEENPEIKTFSINLARNRAVLSPSSKYKFMLEYQLPFEDYSSINWFEQSIKINLYTTTHEFYVLEENVHLVIEGCNDLVFISTDPYAIQQSRGSTILTYISENKSPIERFMVQFTFSIDIFNLLLRPLILILIIALIMSLYVVIIKTRKRKEIEGELGGEFIPFSEIREFCSLYDEKNALSLEIRRAEQAAKSKKMAKKTYSNILSKNTLKIEQIKQELLPFKKVLMDTNETFENLIKKLDVLDAERISVDDSLNLLETRYKRGRLPSKAAYEKLSTDFDRRRKKIDRTIDRIIQQLRSYLL